MGKFPENWERDEPVVEVLEKDTIPLTLEIGTKYHCIWASSKGMVWVFKGLVNGQALLETPKTKRTVITHISNLRHINKNALWQAKQRIKKEKRKLEVELKTRNPLSK